MHRKVIAACVVIVLVVAISCSPLLEAAPTCGNLVGKWKNQLNSVLEITSVNAMTGKIEGTYKIEGDATPWPVTGWVNELASDPNHPNHVDKVIGFSVRFGPYGSVTSWNGYCKSVSGTPTLITQWHLSRPNSDTEWDHIVTNQDRFVPVP